MEGTCCGEGGLSQRAESTAWGRHLLGAGSLRPLPGLGSVPGRPQRGRSCTARRSWTVRHSWTARDIWPAMGTRALRRPYFFPLLLLLLLCGESPPVGGCNEKRMLAMLPRCGKTFAEKMMKVEVWKWCNLSEFIVYYESFTNCTEVETNVVGCYWPNPLAESFIAGVHRQFFQNCSVDRQDWEDPPDEILIPLITVPVLLTIAMTGVVVWRSKHTEQVL